MAVQHKIDINTATEADLLQIPGIDEKKAQAILNFRDSQGRIDNLDELVDAEQVSSRDIASLREWLEDGRNGLLVDPRDPRQAADAMIRAAADDRLRREALKQNTAMLHKLAEISVVRGKFAAFIGTLLK